MRDAFQFHHAGMFKVLMVFQLPGDVEGNVYGLGTDGEGWGDVALQGVAYHEQLMRCNVQVLAEFTELLL